MSISATVKAVLETGKFAVGRWIEIEGIPYAIGNFQAGSSFFGGRTTANKFLGINRTLLAAPKSLDQSIDTLEGGALSAGSTSFDVLDYGETITALTNQTKGSGRVVTFPVADISTTILVNDTLTVSDGDYIYMGNETILVGQVLASPPRFENCQRAQFKSVAKAYGVGFPFSTVPFTMANRRCWYYNQFELNPSQDSFAMTAEDTDYTVLRFSGTVKQLNLKDNDQNSYTLSAETLDKELDRECFRTVRAFTLRGTTIADRDGLGGTCQVPGWPGYHLDYNKIFNYPAEQFSNGEYVLLRIDNEIFGGVCATIGNYPFIQLFERALYGTKAEKHDAGANVQELIPIIGFDGAATSSWGEKASKFNPSVNSLGLSADHPLIIILQVLVSKGTAVATPPPPGWVPLPTFDTLPRDWGMGLDINRVDVTGIINAAKEDPAIRFAGLIDAPVNFLTFVRDLLKFAGYYFVIQTNDVFTIKRLRPPLPDALTTEITNSTRIRNYYTGWEANFRGAIRELKFSYGWDINASKFKRITIFKLPEADLYSNDLARSLKFESKFIYPGGGTIPGEPPFRPFDVDLWLLNRRDFFTVRYARPPPIVRERVDYSYLGVEIGDLVSITHANLPNVEGGARGLVQAVGEVISKTIDETSKTIDLTLLMTGYQLGNYRYISPAMKLTPSAWEWNDPILSIDGSSAEFADTNDGSVDNQINSGGSFGVYPFAVGTSGLIMRNDFSEAVDFVVTSGTLPAIDILIASGAPGAWTPLDGDILIFQTANNPVPFVSYQYRKIFAWTSDDTETLPFQTGTEPAHIYFPG